MIVRLIPMAAFLSAAALSSLWLAQPAEAQTAVPVNPQDLLSQVRGLQLPEHPSWWPPAPGWWLVFALLTLLAFLLYRLIEYYRRKPAGSWQKSALSQHDMLKTAFDNGAALNEVLAQSSVLMRKVALARLPRSKSASVQNDAWLRLLDEIGSTDQYSNGPGRLLLTHPYQRQSDLDRDQVAGLLDLMHTTIVKAPGVALDV